MQEENTQKSRDIVEEIDSYGESQSLYAANRDGDLFYIECPSCHSTDLNAKRLMSCRDCHTHFSLYFEDGIQRIEVKTELGHCRGYSETKGSRPKIKLVAIGNDHKILLPRNDCPETISKIRESYPKAKIVTLYQDLGKDGKDGHGHEKYKRYALIPLD